MPTVPATFDLYDASSGGKRIGTLQLVDICKICSINYGSEANTSDSSHVIEILLSASRSMFVRAQGMTNAEFIDLWITTCSAQTDPNNATTLQSFAVSSTAPSTTEVLAWDGAAWSPTINNLQTVFDILPTISVDTSATPLTIAATDAVATDLVLISNTPSVATGGTALTINTNANATGDVALINNLGTGNTLRVQTNSVDSFRIDSSGVVRVGEDVAIASELEVNGRLTLGRASVFDDSNELVMTRAVVGVEPATVPGVGHVTIRLAANSGEDELYYYHDGIATQMTYDNDSGLSAAYLINSSASINSTSGTFQLANTTDVTDILTLSRTFVGAGHALSLEMGTGGQVVTGNGINLEMGLGSTGDAVYVTQNSGSAVRVETSNGTFANRAIVLESAASANDVRISDFGIDYGPATGAGNDFEIVGDAITAIGSSARDLKLIGGLGGPSGGGVFAGAGGDHTIRAGNGGAGGAAVGEVAGSGGNILIAAGFAGADGGAGGNFGGSVTIDAGDGTTNGGLHLGVNTSGDVNVAGALTSLGFHGSVAVAQQTVTGSRAGNAALASLLTSLATMGLIVDGTTP